MDFKKRIAELNTKAGRNKSMRERLQEESNQRKLEQDSNRRMAVHLLELVENDKIPSDYDCGFIRSVMARLDESKPLSTPMEEYLYKCFNHKY